MESQSLNESQLGEDWIPVRHIYSLLEPIGQGSFGLVLKARHRVSKEIFAIKSLECDLTSVFVLRKMIREIQILQQLSAMEDNVFISKLVDIVVPDGLLQQQAHHVFLVLEFVESDLKKSLRNEDVKKHFKLDNLMAIFYNLLCGTHFLHSAGVMHRDLKPANILIDNNCVVKFCDFGLSRAVPTSPGSENEDASVCSRLIKRISGAGGNPEARAPRRLSVSVQTRWYRSPEVILMDPNYTQKVDIWSLGCIIFELTNLLKDQNLSQNHTQDDVLFSGDYCFPVSPRKGRRDGRQDQLEKILEVKGLQEDLDWVHSEHRLDYLLDLQSKIDYSAEDLNTRLAHIDKPVRQLINKMTALNPAERPSALECLRNPIFDDFRMRDLESPAASKISVAMDFEGAYNYDPSSESLNSESELSLRDYVQILAQLLNIS